jgi:Ca2+-binding RTX toxin-like protein
MAIADIIKYVEEWRTKNTIAPGADLTPDQLIKLANDVQGQVKNLPFKAPVEGANIVPYNGNFGNAQAWKIAKGASESSGGSLCYISDIEAGQLLNSDRFKNALLDAVNGDKTLRDNLINGTWKDNVRSPYGTGDVLALNDFVSKNVMEVNAHGNVMTFTPSSTPDSVWTLTELPTLLEKPEVTSIDGIPKENLLSFRDNLISRGYSESKALEVIRETISYQARENMLSVEIYKSKSTFVEGLNDKGERVVTEKFEITGVDTSKLTGGSPITTVPEGTYEVKTGGEMLGELCEADFNARYPNFNELKTKLGESNSLTVSQTKAIVRTIDQTMGDSPGTDFKTRYPALADAARSMREAKYLEIRGTVFKGLGAAGNILLVADGINMACEANDAYKAGDTARGNKIVRDWTLETAGGFASSAVFAQAVAPLAMALGVCGGPLGIAAAIALELGSGIAGWKFGSELGHDISDLLGWLTGEASGARAPRIDPIVLDLDGDGIETLSVQNGVHFDLDNNGFLEKSGWVKSDDGLLVLDRDGNGKIDAGKELFGDQTVLKNGSVAESGFQALAEFDDNKDGKIDSNDSKYSELKVWRDLNQDGQSSQRELFSLQELGIKSISLTNSSVNTQDSSGNIMRRIGDYEKSDGTSGNLGELLLSRDASDTAARVQEQLVIPEDISALPDIDGIGNIYSLRQAMARDSSKSLQTLIQSFAAEPDALKRNTMLDQILFMWTGVSGIDPASRGTNFDARKLAVIEKFNGSAFSGTGGSNPIAQAVPFLTLAYNKIVEAVYCKLMFQTHLKQILNNNYTWDFITNKASVNLSGVRTAIDQKLSENSSEGIMLLGEFTRTLYNYNLVEDISFGQFRQYFAAKGEEYAWAVDSAGKNVTLGKNSDDSFAGTTSDDAINGMEGDDNISGDAGNDILYGGEGSDSIFGGYGNDTLVGGAGDDKLYGGNGNDTMDGGTGNDYLEGSDGNDTYIFGKGYGEDTVYDYDTTSGNVDVISFTDGVAPEDIVIARKNDNLELSIKGTSDKLTVKNYFSAYDSTGCYYRGDSVNKIEQIRFADGTVWDVAYVKNAARNINGTENADNISGYSDQENIISGFGGNDNISGSYYNDSLTGGDGDDKLYGQGGNDTLDGGTGNDYLEGSYGNDTYVFGKGYGEDTVYDYDTTSGNVDVISFTDGVAPEDIVIARKNDNLELSIKGTSDKLTVKNYFSAYDSTGCYYRGESVNKVEQIRFTDGTVWDVEYVKNAARTINGTENADNISGYSGQENIINGFGGNDNISGSYYNDSLTGGDGDDKLYGQGGNDTMDGGTGNDYLEGSYGNDTYIFGKGYGEDTVYDYDTTSGNVDVISFTDGVAPEDIVVARKNDNLELSINGTNDKLTVKNYFSAYDSTGCYYRGDSVNKVEQIRFDDGTVWDVAYVKNAARNINGTENADNISGYSDQENIISGFGGNDNICGSYYNDSLTGGDGDDKLYGQGGNDTMDGGAGNDYLEGSYGNDTYVFGKGYGEDKIYDYDTSSGNSDSVNFGEEALNMIFAREGNSLKISMANTTDVLTVDSWYSGSAYQLEQLKASNGSILNNTQVEQLIQAMAAFTTQSGMSWNQAITEKPQEIQDILTQFWTHKLV